MVDWRREKRGSYSKAFKRRVVSKTLAPGASVSSVARKHGLNANMVFGWRNDPRFGPGRDATSFLPVVITGPDVPVDPVGVGQDEPGSIEITLSNGHRLSVQGSVDRDLVRLLAKDLLS